MKKQTLSSHMPDLCVAFSNVEIYHRENEFNEKLELSAEYWQRLAYVVCIP
jgi:hypothetical protein